MSTIRHFRGDNFTYEITVLDEDNEPINIAGASITFSVKASVEAASYQYQRTVGSGITITNGAGGVFEVAIVPANTNSMAAGSFVWDAEIVLSGGAVYTVPRAANGDPDVGDYILVAEVTRPA